MPPKTMTEDEMRRFINRTHRVEGEESDEAAWIYCKAIRASLEALGYEHYWIEGPFREALQLSYFGSESVCNSSAGVVVSADE